MNLFSKLSHYRIVKILYTLYISVFMFIMEINLFGTMYSNEIGMKDFLVLILLGLLMEYLNYKEKNPKLILGMVVFIDLCYSLIFYGTYSSEDYFVLSFILNLIYILIHNKFNEEKIYNDYYKKLGKILSLILLGSIVFYGFLTPYEINYLFKGYLAYLICYILLLREGRRFCFKIYKKEDNIITSLYVMFIIFMFTPICNKIMKSIIWVLEKLLEGLAYIIATILYYTIGKLMLKIRNLIKSNPIKPSSNKSNNAGNVITDLFKGVNPDAVYSTWFFIVVYSIIIVLIILLLIYVVKKFRIRTIEKAEFIEKREKVESISFIKRRKKVSCKNNKDKNRNLIFVYYRKFLILVWEKGLYKNYMTSRQVKSMVRTEVSNKDEELKILSEVYNEAKFSNHNLNEEKVKNVENAYKEVKKVLK